MGENYVNGGAKYDVNLFTDSGEGDVEPPLIQQRNGKLGYVIILNVIHIINYVQYFTIK